MLKEQLLAFAATAIVRVHDAREKIKSRLNNHAIKYYAESLKDAALWLIENRLKPEIRDEHFKEPSEKTTRDQSKKVPKASSSRVEQPVSLVIKKERKSSIRPAKEIASSKAEIILGMLKKDDSRLVKAKDQLLGKKSLAYLVWALGHAERASLKEGISVHDVSALLYKACKIDLYPINISRVVHSNDVLVRQAGQEKRTKTYLLTPTGAKIFKEKFIV